MSSLRQIYVHVYIRMHASFVSGGKGVAVHHLTGEAMETAASSWVLRFNSCVCVCMVQFEYFEVPSY